MGQEKSSAFGSDLKSSLSADGVLGLSAFVASEAQLSLKALLFCWLRYCLRPMRCVVDGAWGSRKEAVKLLSVCPAGRL